MVNTYESKYAHEMDQFGSVFDDSDVDRQLSFVAIDRHQNRQKTTNIDGVHTCILILLSRPFILRGNRTPDYTALFLIGDTRVKNGAI